MATVPTKTVTNTATISGESGCSANVLPACRIASPRQMMMKSAQRSARCAPETSQSTAVDLPKPGTAKPKAGAAYSIASAASHNATRVSPSVTAPETQKMPDNISQQVM